MWVQDWLLHMGAAESTVTQASGDGGIDITSTHFISQVKLYVGSVGIADIREFIGVASYDSNRRAPLFFTSGQYPSSAIQIADQTGMALFHFAAETGVVTGINSLAQEYAMYGFFERLE